MAGRPSLYDWKAIESDYKAGLPIDRICQKHTIEKKTLQNKISEKKWVVSGNAKAVMQGFEEISGNIGIIQGSEPEILEAVYDRIRTESEFDIMAGRIVIKAMKKLEKVIDDGKKLEKVNVGNGVQNLEPVGMMGGDYKDALDAVYRGKEIIKGKEASTNVNVNTQTNVGIQTITRKIVD